MQVYSFQVTEYIDWIDYQEEVVLCFYLTIDLKLPLLTSHIELLHIVLELPNTKPINIVSIYSTRPPSSSFPAHSYLISLDS